ncbi:MAG TPA: C40 family peptidase [Motilibacteraceae bacterium]|nr:C40 family peptidase [Motilibacteraceae bacterium]
MSTWSPAPAAPSPPRSRPRRSLLLLLLVLALLLGACAGASPTAPTTPAGPAASAGAAAVTTAPRLRVGGSAWASVAVATLWRTPTSPRPVDAPALAAPVRIRAWLAGMTLAQRRALSGRADTQVLLGDRVVVTALRTGWAKVVVPDQPTLGLGGKDRRGYPGWVPTRQLTARPPAATGRTATVLALTTWLRTDDSHRSAMVEVGIGTRLPLVGTAAGWLRVRDPLGRVLRLSGGSAVVTTTGRAPVSRTGPGVVRSAQRFTGLAYLWAGRSGFGVDCSGLTSLAYRLSGVTIPRDADAQALTGRAVPRSALLPGGLLFYRRNGVVHHVAMYVGAGKVIHAPGTGTRVQTVPTSTPWLAREYAGARRYL